MLETHIRTTIESDVIRMNYDYYFIYMIYVYTHTKSSRSISFFNSSHLTERILYS